jgi:hypothetical protein
MTLRQQQFLLAFGAGNIAGTVRRVAENNGGTLAQARCATLARSAKVTGYSYSMNRKGAVRLASSLMIIRLRHDFPLGIESRSSRLARFSPVPPFPLAILLNRDRH